MDETDKKILELLQNNSRMSYNDISQNIGKTEATVRRRVKKLINNGIIKKFTINYKLNTKPNTYATIIVAPDLKDIKRIISELKKIEDITDIWRLSRDCGLLLKVQLSTIEQINPLIEEKLSQIAGIKILETCFITDIIK